MRPVAWEHLLQALQNDTEFRTAVRNMLLSEELLALPERLAQFTTYALQHIQEQQVLNARIEGFVEKQQVLNARIEGFVEKQQVLNARIEGFVEKQQVFNARIEGFIAKVDNFIEKQEVFNAKVDDFIEKQEAFNARIEGFIAKVDNFIEKQEVFNRRTDASLAILKGNATRMLLRDHHETILEMLQLDFVRTLGRDDLTRMVRNSGRSNQISFGQRRSFYAADLVLEATDVHGNTHYIATEASFTADRRDTERAQRNAAFITGFTGQPTHAVVASVANDREVQGLVESGAIQWFQLDERELQPD